MIGATALLIVGIAAPLVEALAIAAVIVFAYWLLRAGYGRLRKIC